jgi:hypothetical protein
MGVPGSRMYPVGTGSRFASATTFIPAPRKPRPALPNSNLSARLDAAEAHVRDGLDATGSVPTIGVGVCGFSCQGATTDPPIF